MNEKLCSWRIVEELKMKPLEGIRRDYKGLEGIRTNEEKMT